MLSRSGKRVEEDHGPYGYRPNRQPYPTDHLHSGHRVRVLLHHQGNSEAGSGDGAGEHDRGRPLIIVSEDYENLPTINLIIQNVGAGPAKNITFTFSVPVESSDGYVLSDLSIFTEGITSLAPGARIVCYWDELGNLQPMVREGRLERPVAVTVEYQDIAGGVYSHDWEIDPSLYEGLRTFGNKSMNEVVEAVENVVQEIAKDRGQWEDNRGEEG